jgi:hypothetical protein
MMDRSYREAHREALKRRILEAIRSPEPGPELAGVADRMREALEAIDAMEPIPGHDTTNCVVCADIVEAGQAVAALEGRLERRVAQVATDQHRRVGDPMPELEARALWGDR